MQTKTKLSPGPWIVLEPYTNRSAFLIAYQQGEVSHIIAEVNSQGGTPEQCRANADCMAAARELLEAGKELILGWTVEQCPKCAGSGFKDLHKVDTCHRCGGLGEVVDRDPSPNDLRRLRAAIAKAEGRP